MSVCAVRELKDNPKIKCNLGERHLRELGICKGTGLSGCLCCSMLFCHVLCRGSDLQLWEIPGMAENIHTSFCDYSDFRYGPSDAYFPGYTSGIVYECIGAYDDAFYDGNA